jgi:shikimate kinase
MRNLVFLTGFMGTGKTAVGRLLARRLGRRFIDLDREIERAAGMSVAEIFVRFGEPDFRAREQAILEQMSRLDDAVVATGGGAVLDERSRATMRASGRVVCLSADVATILERVGGGADRPLLADAADRAARVRTLLGERAAAYADADWVVSTTQRSVDEVVEDIASRLAAEAARVPSAATRG